MGDFGLAARITQYNRCKGFSSAQKKNGQMTVPDNERLVLETYSIVYIYINIVVSSSFH